MTVQKLAFIAEISKNKDVQMQIDELISVNDISKVKLNQKVNIALTGVNTQKYGTLK